MRENTTRALGFAIAVVYAGLIGWDAWRHNSGFDPNGTYTTSAPPTRVQIQPNSYEPGRAIVDRVTRRRRKEIATILRSVPEQNRNRLVEALNAFAEAAGEVPEQAWSLGWSA